MTSTEQAVITGDEGDYHSHKYVEEKEWSFPIVGGAMNKSQMASILRFITGQRFSHCGGYIEAMVRMAVSQDEPRAPTTLYLERVNSKTESEEGSPYRRLPLCVNAKKPTGNPIEWGQQIGHNSPWGYRPGMLYYETSAQTLRHNATDVTDLIVLEVSIWFQESDLIDARQRHKKATGC